jgi:hypothetical protein
VNVITENQIYLFHFLVFTLFQNNHNAGCKKENVVTILMEKVMF